jgi:hypothetical protein
MVGEGRGKNRENVTVGTVIIEVESRMCCEVAKAGGVG